MKNIRPNPKKDSSVRRVFLNRYLPKPATLRVKGGSVAAKKARQASRKNKSALAPKDQTRARRFYDGPRGKSLTGTAKRVAQLHFKTPIIIQDGKYTKS